MKLLTFDTTHHALWAEELAMGKGLGAQVVPAPADADAKCDLSLEVLPEDFMVLVDALRAVGVQFRVYR
ncbi:MAG: DUF3343 domain-containing protein [Longimicrobiales bacterium]